MPKDIIEEQSINERNIEILTQNFPNAIETDEDGNITINAQKLQMALDPSKVKVEEDGYELRWVGKKEAYHTAFTKNRKILKPLKDDSKEWDTTGNILIKGDNLDALRILKHSYFEQIKMIYIDPPYNTKSDEFVYNDDFTATQEETLDALGYSKESRDYVKNIYGAKTHSGWLSFMYPRLLLARDLLKEDGAIFISIDDNEVAQLKILCDEVFGDENFEAQISWRRRHNQPNDKSKMIAKVSEYILVYAKNSESLKKQGTYYGVPLTEDRISEYTNPDDDTNGAWTSNPWKAAIGRGGSHYVITTPTGIKFDEVWYGNDDTFEKHKNDKRVHWTDNGNGYPRIKKYLSEALLEGQPAIDFFKHELYGSNSEASAELQSLFLSDGVFNNPKPVKLISSLLKISTKNNDLVLDFFAGSGTTAHAIMDLNATDGGNRKFICVQWAESTPAKGEARKAGYETIFDITRARIDKAGNKIAANENLISQNIDIGFRVFEVIDDEKQAIYSKKLSEVTQSDLTELADTPKSEEPETILYNLLTAEKLSLDTKIDELEKGVFYGAKNVGIVLGAFDIGRLRAILKEHGEIEYISVYSPLIEDDNFNLMLHSLLEQDEYKKYKLRIRG